MHINNGTINKSGPSWPILLYRTLLESYLNVSFTLAHAISSILETTT